MRRSLLCLLLALLAVVSTACSSALHGATVAANGTHAALTTSHDLLEAAERAHLDATVELSRSADEARARGEKLHRLYRPVWALYTKACLAWVVAGSSIEAARAVDEAGGEPDMATVATAMAKLADAMTKFRDAAAALESGVADAQ